LDLTDGAVIMIGGFGGAGTPQNLVQGIVDREVKELTIVANSFNYTVILKARDP